MFSTTVTQTITVGRQPPRDRFGDPSGTLQKHTVAGCVWWPASSSEAMNRSDSVTTGNGVLAPIGSDIRAADAVWLEADDPDQPPRWQVNGDPGQPQSAFTGWQPGLVVSLQRYKG